jgi:hypothetical protein
MAKRWPAKDPQEVLDYAIDWSGRLGGDTVAQSTWDVPVGLTKDSESVAPTMTTLWLSSGQLNKTYDITNHIITSGGRRFDQTVRLKIKTK